MDRNGLTENEAMKIDIMKLLRAFLQRWWLFIAVGVVFGAAMYVYSYFYVTPMYRTSASLFVNVKQSQMKDENDYLSTSDLSISRYLVPTYVSLSTSDNVLNEVSNYLGEGYSVGLLKGSVYVEQITGTSIFTISVSSYSPTEAAKIANAMADVVPHAISRILDGGDATVIDYAKVPGAPYAPDYTRNVLMGVIVGFVLVALILALMFYLDVRVKDEDDLNELSSYPLLGRIPEFSILSSKSIKNSKYAEYKSSASKQEN